MVVFWAQIWTVGAWRTSSQVSSINIYQNIQYFRFNQQLFEVTPMFWQNCLIDRPSEKKKEGSKGQEGYTCRPMMMHTMPRPRATIYYMGLSLGSWMSTVETVLYPTLPQACWVQECLDSTRACYSQSALRNHRHQTITKKAEKILRLDKLFFSPYFSFSSQNTRVKLYPHCEL